MTDQHDNASGSGVPPRGPGAGAFTGGAASAASGGARSSTAVAPVARPEEVGEQIFTIPNLISFARLLGVPVFLWLVLGLRTQTGDWWAVGLLVASGISDWLDGKIARALGQQSRLGQLLDPAADRLYIVATVIALAVRAIIPWWLVILLAARELLMAVVLAILRRRGWGPLQVSFAGKAATLCLLYAFPLLFLGAHSASYAEATRIIGWTFVFWGSALYWWAAGLYIVQAKQLLAQPLVADPGSSAGVIGPGGRDGLGGSGVSGGGSSGSGGSGGSGGSAERGARPVSRPDKA